MNETELTIRRLTYSLFVELGRAPLSGEVAEAARIPEAEVRAAWQCLHDAHALVLDQAGTAIRMANPFSGVPTPHRVKANGRWWFANCAWDAFGICAALGADGEIETSCPDCGDALLTGVRNRLPTNPEPVFHCLVPAGAWWTDIGFT